MCICKQAFTFWNHRFSRKALYLRYTHTKDISKCTHVCHLLMMKCYCEGKLARNAALFYESAYIKCSVEESMIFLWFLNLVLHIWCCTVFICLFFFFKYAEALNLSLYSTWCTNRTEKWRHPLSKGKPLALITSYHFIKQHQVSVFHSTLYCSVLWICCCNYAEEIYKDLAFIIWLFNVSFLFPHFRYCVVEPSIA